MHLWRRHRVDYGDCGDGVANNVVEACDDGGESAVCDADCTPVVCGDGVRNASAGEPCDDGGESATCDDTCQLSSCGNGNMNRSAGEVCDDGNTTPGDGCSAACRSESCGNGVVDAGSTRAIRGCHYHSYAGRCRAATRLEGDPSLSYDATGFRLARSL